MTEVVISGSGLFTPAEAISNAELVAAHSKAVDAWNRAHADDIASGRLEERVHSSERFIVKASGVRSRYVIEKSGILDPDRMRPHLPTRSEDERSIQCEVALAAAGEALEQARCGGEEIDAVLVACSNLQRAYPAVAVEVQNALGADGWAYDLNVACSSATFALQAAADAIRAGSARRVLVVNPEITSGHNNFALRDYHFIFGDACTALVVEASEGCRAERPFAVLGTRLRTRFSNNIRNDFGFLNASEDEPRDSSELVFRQRGRQVYREVCPLVAEHILSHLAANGLEPGELKRMWLHQANLGMNELIARRVLGRPAEKDEAPVILDEYANTSSAGSVIAFHKTKDDFTAGEIGMLCSFGAGYSIGSALLRSEVR